MFYGTSIQERSIRAILPGPRGKLALVVKDSRVGSIYTIMVGECHTQRTRTNKTLTSSRDNATHNTLEQTKH